MSTADLTGTFLNLIRVTLFLSAYKNKEASKSVSFSGELIMLHFHSRRQRNETMSRCLETHPGLQIINRARRLHWSLA